MGQDTGTAMEPQVSVNGCCRCGRGEARAVHADVDAVSLGAAKAVIEMPRRTVGHGYHRARFASDKAANETAGEARWQVVVTLDYDRRSTEPAGGQGDQTGTDAVRVDHIGREAPRDDPKGQDRAEKEEELPRRPDGVQGKAEVRAGDVELFDVGVPDGSLERPRRGASHRTRVLGRQALEEAQHRVLRATA